MRDCGMWRGSLGATVTAEGDKLGGRGEAPPASGRCGIWAGGVKKGFPE